MKCQRNKKTAIKSRIKREQEQQKLLLEQERKVKMMSMIPFIGFGFDNQNFHLFLFGAGGLASWQLRSPNRKLWNSHESFHWHKWHELFECRENETNDFNARMIRMSWMNWDNEISCVLQECQELGYGCECNRGLTLFLCDNVNWKDFTAGWLSLILFWLF